VIGRRHRAMIVGLIDGSDAPHQGGLQVHHDEGADEASRTRRESTSADVGGSHDRRWRGPREAAADAPRVAGWRAWETTTSSGTHGIFLRINTHASGPAERRTIAEQTTDIRLYHRTARGKTWGWYRDDRFDGERLRVAGLDVTFDAARRRWSGTWPLDGDTHGVVLERPRSADGSKSCPVCGDWEGVPEPARFAAHTVLHVVQSSDGPLTAWIDRMIAIMDQRHGELLEVLSSDPANVTFALVSSGGPAIRFNGKLSADGLKLSGRWDGGSGGYRFNASENLGRLRSGERPPE
jgi:hypothetical protein